MGKYGGKWGGRYAHGQEDNAVLFICVARQRRLVFKKVVQGLLHIPGKRMSLGASIVLLYQAFVRPSTRSIHADKTCPIPCTCCRPCIL